jgi:regulator of sirC expression with transglutaminase-like and TPR domain
LQRALTLVEYLGVELGFGGSAGEFHHPDNIHIQRVIERKRGMPLALCAVYLLVARRAGLRAGCVPLPGHVMLRLHGDKTSLIVDPYHKGQARSDSDCRKYLEQNDIAFKPAWMRDADDAVLLKRQIANLARSAQIHGRKREARELSILSRAFEPRQAQRAART